MLTPVGARCGLPASALLEALPGDSRRPPTLPGAAGSLPVKRGGGGPGLGLEAGAAPGVMGEGSMPSQFVSVDKSPNPEKGLRIRNSI